MSSSWFIVLCISFICLVFAYTLLIFIPGLFVECEQEEVAFKKFLMFLETAKNRTRPAYDGVAVVFQDEDIIPVFFRFLSRTQTRDWFWRVVSSVGSVYTYVKFTMARNLGVLDNLEKTKLENGDLVGQLYYVVFRLRIDTKRLFSDLKASYLYKTLLKALDDVPNYANLFKVCTLFTNFLKLFKCLY